MDSSRIQARQINRVDQGAQSGEQIAFDSAASGSQVEKSKFRVGNLRSELSSPARAQGDLFTSPAKAATEAASSKTPKLSREEIYAEINDFYKVGTGGKSLI